MNPRLPADGPSVPDVYRKLGGYTARVLKGEKPGDLPIEHVRLLTRSARPMKATQ